MTSRVMIFLCEQTPYLNNLQAIILQDIAWKVPEWGCCGGSGVMAPVAAHTNIHCLCC